MATLTPEQKLPAESRVSPARFFSKFTVLRGAIRELWVVFGGKLFTILAYQVMNLTLVLWLSSDLGFDDVHAGYVVAAWSALMTLFTVLVGSFVDAVGLRKAFLLGVGLCVFSRGLLTATTTRWLALGAGLLPLALGEALMVPVMVAAVRRYSTTPQRSISYAIFFALMNGGFWLAARVFDWIRRGLGEHGQFTVPILGAHLSTYRTLFLTSFLLSVPNLLLMYFGIREGAEATDEGLKFNRRLAPPAGRSGFLLWRATNNTLRETGRIFAGLWKQTAFYKFLAFLFVLVALRVIYFHMYYTYPKFGIRELGAGAPVGQLWSINGIVLLILVPIVGALTQKIPAFKMILVGSCISASSLFIMTFPPDAFAPLAQGWFGDFIGHSWLGVKGDVHPYYVMIFLYVLLLSIGESLWNPRLYEYTASIAPKGQEGSYMALSYLPFFIAKFFVGMFSGLLLSHYCPAVGPRHSQTLWLWIALSTLTTPVCLILFGRYLRVHEVGRSE